MLELFKNDEVIITVMNV